jgi:hypothetical protein
MDDAAIDHLRAAVALYGSELNTDWQRTQNVLRELCAGKCGADKHQRETAALTAAVREEVTTVLLSATRPPPPTLGDRLTRMLTNNAAIEGEVANWAVRAWAAVLQVPGLRFSAVLRNFGEAAGRSASPGFTPSAGHATRLASAAAHAAISLAIDDGRAAAIAAAACAFTAIDADRSARLLTETETALRLVARPDRKSLQQHAIVVALSATHSRYAESLALTISSRLRDHALAYLAEVIGQDDFDRVLRLAREISDSTLRMYTMGQLVTATASADPGRAVHRARLLTSGYWLAETLCSLAAVMAAYDPAKAAALIREAQSLARSLPDYAMAAAALSSAARALHAADPASAADLFAEAERLARAASGPAGLGSLAIALAASDPDRSLSLAAELPDNWYATGEIVKIMARSQPERAVNVAQSIRPQTPHLADVAAVLAEADPEGALFLAWSVQDPCCQASALVGIARILAGSDSDRAARLLGEAEQAAQQLPASLHKVMMLSAIACVWGDFV